MSTAFVADIEHILLNMSHWLNGAILGEQSRMRSIIIAESENTKSWYPPSGNLYSIDPAKAAENQLCMLVTLKVTLFDHFAAAIRKLLNFFKIAKVFYHFLLVYKLK